MKSKTIKRFYCSCQHRITFTDGSTRTNTEGKGIFASSAENALLRYKRQLRPTYSHTERLADSFKVEPAVEFEIKVKSVKRILWWEKSAVEHAEGVVEDPYDALSLVDLSNLIEEAWSQEMNRDGEPGPRAGHVDFEVNDEETKLVIRSKRILAVVTITPTKPNE